MLDYKKAEMEAMKRNIAELKEDIYQRIKEQLKHIKLENWLETKIENYAKKHGKEVELVKLKVISDDWFMSTFSKDPIKQGFHQKLAQDYIRSIPHVSDFKALPNHQKNAKYVMVGKIMSFEDVKDINRHTKSIDFEWIYTNSQGKKIPCYASHKYTNEMGGAQDNQFRDMQEFLKEASFHQGEYFFYAICDGNYYQNKYDLYPNRINYLNECHRGKRSFSLTINELKEHMQNIL